MGNKTFDFSSKKKDFLPKKDQIKPEIDIFVHCWLIWCPVGGLVGGRGAGCILQDTSLLYLLILLLMFVLRLQLPANSVSEYAKKKPTKQVTWHISNTHHQYLAAEIILFLNIKRCCDENLP